MKKKKFVALMIGIVLSFVLVLGGFLLVQNVFTRAASERPQNVIITNATETSAQISWTTDNEVSGGAVQYGTSPAVLTSFAPSDQIKSKNHTAELTLLIPGTTYYFHITYGENRNFDNSGAAWTFTTKTSGEEPDLVVTPKLVPTTKVDSSPIIETKVQICSETDCTKIKAKLGQGCSTQEYIRCIKNENNPSPTN